jgi:hypothetical protein
VEWIIARESETVPTSNYKIQDCLGMTPLHILACSSKHDLRLYQWVVATHPKSIITEDKWGYLPIFYAVWVNAREEILHYLVACLETHAISLKWNSMVETMCGAGASVERVQTLLNIHRTSFPEDSIDWQKVARALTMSCVLRIVTLGSPGNGQTINILWDSMMVCIRSSHSQDGELIQHLEKIQEVLFPIPIDTTWNLFYEKFARYFWNNSPFYHVPFEMFRFLAKCNIFDRVERLRVGKMQSEMHSMLTIIQDDDDDSQEDWYDKIYSTLISYEQINDSLYLLELAAWKYRIISSQQDGINNDCDDANCVKWMYRVDCGANVIIDNVLSFLIGD